MLYKRKEKIYETYPEYCDKIWNYLQENGNIYFDRNRLENYWRDFSDEYYSAGFMEVSTDTLGRFEDWLENY